MSEQMMTQTKPKSIYAMLTPISHSVLQRCSNGVECEECRKKRESSLQRAAVSPAPTNGVPPIVHDVLSSPGQSLDAGTRSFMESRFGHDFSGVRVHTGERAFESARSVNALAYTVGRDVVFGMGQYMPNTTVGRRLLAHELTHVVQQAETVNTDIKMDSAPSQAAYEREAEHSAVSIISEYNVSTPKHSAGLYIARFSDTGHHIIEEAGLGGAGFSKEEIGQIEAGNIQRDYSQVGVVFNTLLLCKPDIFGGYNPTEHFDDFAWDKATETWKIRGAASQTGLTQSPIDYITSELLALAREGKTEKGLLHLGNAFHTVEDFFAHSNFIELVNHDYSFGKDLVTGSFGKVDEIVSLSHKLEAVSSPPMDRYYQAIGEKATQQTEPLSHSRISKDEPASHNYEQAQRLAALVVQELGREVGSVMQQSQADDRVKAVTEGVIATIRRYLRPPADNDKWWESLAASDKGAIDQRLEEARRRTPATVNQCFFSPLKNLEASKDSSIKIPIGVVLPVQIGKNQVWIQAGAGIVAPFQPLPGSMQDVPERTGSISQGFFVGGQIAGRF